MGICRIVVVSSIVLLAVPVFAPASAATPSQPSTAFFQPYQATYSTTWKKGISVKVEGTQTLSKVDDTQWRFKFAADTFFAKLSEESLFEQHDQSVRPLAYHYQSSILGKEKETHITFDWANMTATNDAKKKPWQTSIKNDTLDQLSMQLQLRYDLKQTPSGSFSYQIADNGKLKQYAFEAQGEEEIKTKFGVVKAIKVKRTDSGSEKRRSYFWFAPKYDYLLVKMEHHERGESYILDLEKLSLK